MLRNLSKGDFIRLKDGRDRLYEVLSVSYQYGVYIITYFDNQLGVNITSEYRPNGKYVSEEFAGDNLDICEVI